MTEEVRLTITGVQKAFDGSEERSEVRTDARYQATDEGIILEYEEEGTPCIMVLEEDRIALTRGVGEMNLIAGEETVCEYETPYGVIPMRIVTQSIAVRESPRSIHARTHYRILMEPDIEVESMVTVRVEPV